MKRRTRPLVFFIPACVLAASVLITPSGLGADEGRFSAEASAQGVRKAVVARGFLVVEQVELSGPAAFAQVDSIGSSTAFGAYPYPGDALLGVPGLIASQGGPSLPAYPLIAQTSFPTVTDSSVTNGPIMLTAKSTETSSSGAAVGGSQSEAQSLGLTKTTADVAKETDGTVRAKGDAVVEALSFGGDMLRIGRVHSVATAVTPPSGKEELSSGLEVGEMSIAGQKIELTDQGLVVAGTTIPVDASPLGDALEGAGIFLHLVAPLRDVDGRGITAPAIEVTVAQNVVGGPEPETLTYTIGRASARSDASGLGAVGGIGGGVGQPTAPQPQGPAGEQPSARSDLSDGGTTGGTATEPAVQSPGGGPSQVTPVAATDRNSLTGLYIALVIAAIALLGGSQLIRFLGVRLGWIS